MAQDTTERIRQAKQRFGIVGNAPALTEAIGRALRVAPIDLSVLIIGESGTGKEFFPKIIHAYSARKHARYIAVNCGAIPEGTIDSELFGHEKGAFTGAVASRKGYFEEADGGTIFLDEVAELPLTTQARLLRVLETGEYIRVGSSTVQRTNIRIVAATNVDMARAVADGRFREDLYYRLSTVSIAVPPLRDRGGDIMLLTRRFASDFAERYRTPAVRFDDSAQHRLTTYRWPGNVRQLKNVIDQISLFEAGNDITADMLDHYLPADTGMSLTLGNEHARAGSSRYDTEREMLLNLIFRLQKEIEDLRTYVHDKDAASATVAPATTSLCHLRDRDTVPNLKPAPDTLGGISNLDSIESDNDTVDVAATEAHDPDETERDRIRRALARNEGRRAATAADLGISERTLYRKIRDLNLD